MSSQNATKLRCGLGVLLLALIYTQAWADDPVADLAVAVANEYDILEPSVKRAANDLLDSVKRFNDKQKSQPAIDWTTESRKPQQFVNSDNQIESLDTELAYAVTAVDREYQYRLKGISKIVRTGRRNFPFAASVEIKVTFVDQIAEVERIAPIPVPKGYRKPKATDDDLEFVLGEARVVDEVVRIAVSRRFPVPHGPYVERDVEAAPKPVQDIAAEVRKACKKAKPQKNHAMYTVIFVYSLNERRWESRESAAGS